MCTTLSAKYYQKIKKEYKKKPCKRYQNLSKQEEENKRQCGSKSYKISQKVRNKCLLRIEKNIIEWEKMLCYNYKKAF